jgi:hypothetical protein
VGAERHRPAHPQKQIRQKKAMATFLLISIPQ